MKYEEPQMDIVILRQDMLIVTSGEDGPLSGDLPNELGKDLGDY